MLVYQRVDVKDVGELRTNQILLFCGFGHRMTLMTLGPSVGMEKRLEKTLSCKYSHVLDDTRLGPLDS